jgi:hypothetical protein
MAKGPRTGNKEIRRRRHASCGAVSVKGQLLFPEIIGGNSA